jgi:hypothetical protein
MHSVPGQLTSGEGGGSGSRYAASTKENLTGTKAAGFGNNEFSRKAGNEVRGFP